MVAAAVEALPAAPGVAAVLRAGVAVVALFAGIEQAVTAERAAENLLCAAEAAAAVAVTRVPVITLFGRFDDVVGTPLETLPTAEDGTVVTVPGVSVVALLPGIEEAVTTAGSQRGFISAEAAAAVAVIPVTIVTLFAQVEHIIAAPRACLDAAEIIAAVAVIPVTVVTLFAGIEQAVAATRRGGGGRGGSSTALHDDDGGGGSADAACAGRFGELLTGKTY